MTPPGGETAHWTRLRATLDSFADEENDQVANQRGEITPAQADAIARHAVRHVAPRRGRRVLELCCGTGLLARQFAAEGAVVTASDLSHRLLVRGSRDAQGTGVGFVQSNAVALGFRSQSFDAICFNNAVLYFDVDSLRATMVELRRLVRDEGLVFIGDVPNPSREWAHLTRYVGLRGRALGRALVVSYKRQIVRALLRRPIPGQWYRPSDLRRLASEAGFEMTLVRQGKELPYHFWRYDAVLRPR